MALRFMLEIMEDCDCCFSPVFSCASNRFLFRPAWDVFCMALVIYWFESFRPSPCTDAEFCKPVASADALSLFCCCLVEDFADLRCLLAR